jgi:hypothetical protein
MNNKCAERHYGSVVKGEMMDKEEIMEFIRENPVCFLHS